MHVAEVVVVEVSPINPSGVIAMAFPAAARHPVDHSVEDQLPDRQGADQVAVTAVVRIERIHGRTDQIGVITQKIGKMIGRMLPKIVKTADRMLLEISTMIAKIGMMIAVGGE